MPVSYNPETGRLFTQYHAGVFASADSYANNCGLAGKSASTKLNHRIQKHFLDSIPAITGKQHSVIGSEQATLVHCGDIEPVGVRFHGVFNLRCACTDIIVVVFASQRMDTIGAKRNVGSRFGGRTPECALECDESALNRNFIAEFNVIARQPGIRAHGTLICDRRVPVVNHGVEHKTTE